MNTIHYCGIDDCHILFNHYHEDDGRAMPIVEEAQPTISDGNINNTFDELPATREGFNDTVSLSLSIELQRYSLLHRLNQRAPGQRYAEIFKELSQMQLREGIRLLHARNHDRPPAR